MRYALISDIHANIEALEAVLSSAIQHRADRIVCLGDIVGYNANPNECIALLDKLHIECIAGNHDRVALGLYEPTRFGERGRRAIYWTRRALTAQSKEFLSRLPLTRSIDNRFFVVHGALHPEPNADLHLSNKARIRSSLLRLASGDFGARLCFFGHTHRAAVYTAESRATESRSVESRATESRSAEGRSAEGRSAEGRSVQSATLANLVAYDRPVHLPDFATLVNPGSVGQPKEDDPRASFVLFDSQAQSLEFYRVPFDVDSCKAKASAAGLLYEEPRLRATLTWVTDRLESGAGLALRAARRARRALT